MCRWFITRIVFTTLTSELVKASNSPLNSAHKRLDVFIFGSCGCECLKNQVCSVETFTLGLKTRKQGADGLRLTQLADVCFHLVHPLQYSLTPDGVIAVGPLKFLHVGFDFSFNGAEVRHSGGHGKDQQ